MIQVPSEDLRILLESGYLYLGMQRYKEAKEVFEGVVVLAPKSEVPLVALGNVYCVQAKFEQAIKTYKEALDLDPKSAFAMAYMGEALFFKGDKEKAVEALDKASKLDPDGKSGDFARSLLDLIKKGFTPVVAPQK
ncbi:MAG: tetratricopeptide repeat protein [Deltaproteobacteria bacterium]|nr:tetratricopeptide repeat protein [Deltaproteobacteria bacterium]